MSVVKLPTITSDVDPDEIDRIIRDAEARQNKNVIEALAAEMEFERTLISGLKGKQAQLEKQKTELENRLAPLREKKQKLEGLKDFIPEDQYKKASSGLDDLSSGIELQVDHINAIINQEILVELFEHTSLFEAQQKQMHTYPVDVRINLSVEPVSEAQEREALNLKALKALVKGSVLPEKLRRLSLGIYGDMPMQNRELLRSIFNFSDLYTAMPSDGDKMVKGVRNNRVCAVVCWKYIRDTEPIRKACLETHVPFILVDTCSKSTLVIAVAKEFGLDLS